MDTQQVIQEIDARIAAAGRGQVIYTHVYPPIPVRNFDWSAHFENDEPNDAGSMLIGYGKTAPEALADLLDNFDNR